MPETVHGIRLSVGDTEMNDIFLLLKIIYPMLEKEGAQQIISSLRILY